MSAQSSLRDLYTDTSSAWSFLPAPNNLAPKASSTSPTYEWKTPRNSSRYIFDLSPSQDMSDSGADASQLLVSYVGTAFLQYTSTAIAMPWEVGRLLLQVQWVPRDAGNPELLDEAADDDGEVRGILLSLDFCACADVCS